MNITFADRLPEILMRQLFESDCSTDGTPVPRPDNRELAVHWLQRLLVDFDALDQHIALLQKLYAAPFQYPRPRRDRWDMDQMLDPPTDSNFKHVDRLPDDQVAAILDKGIDALTDDELGALLLNPYALFDLFDCIDDVQPEYWLDALHELVSTESPKRRPWLPKVETTNRSEHTPTHASANSRELQHNLESALVLSKQLAEVLVREAPSQRSRGMQYALALAATVAFVMVGWGVFQMSSAVRSLPEQIAMISRGTDTTPLSEGTGTLPTGTSGRTKQTLLDFYVDGTLRPSYYENENKGASKVLDDEILAHAEPALRELIVMLKKKGMSADAVLVHLRTLCASKQTQE